MKLDGGSFAIGRHLAIGQTRQIRIGRIETASTTDHLPLADSQPRGIVVYQPVGLVEPRDPRPGASRGRGRPAKLFALTELGREGFDQQYDDLAVQALRFLADTGGDDALRAFAEQRVSFIEARFGATREAHPELTPAQVLARVFTDEGYAAGVRELPVVNGQSAGEQLCQQHCPVSHVAHEFPQLCEAETQAISRVLGRHVQRLATIAHGDGVCTPRIPDLPTTSTTSSTEKERVTS